MVNTVAGQVATIRTHRKGCVVTGQVLQGQNQWGVAASGVTGAKPCKKGCGSRSGDGFKGDVEGDQM